MGSSGVSVRTRIIFGECENTDVCDWAGETDEWVDPETRFASWECPACKHQHETSESVFDEDGDPDAAHDRRGEDA